MLFFRQGTKQDKKDNSEFVKKQNRAEKHKESPKFFFYHMLYNSQISYIGYCYSYNDEKRWSKSLRLMIFNPSMSHKKYNISLVAFVVRGEGLWASLLRTLTLGFCILRMEIIEWGGVWMRLLAVTMMIESDNVCKTLLSPVLDEEEAVHQL